MQGEKGAQKKQKIDKDEASVAKKGTQKKEEAEKEAAPISKEVQKDKGASAAKSKAKKKRNGPMKDAMQRFFDQKREQGKSYRKTQRLWVKSAERAAVMKDMTLAEKKRRRYL